MILKNNISLLTIIFHGDKMTLKLANS